VKRSGSASAGRFGIGEWFGRLVDGLSEAERGRLCEAARKKAGHAECPFRPAEDDVPAVCNKEGGVCSLRFYEQTGQGGVVPASRFGALLDTTCPNRFLEGDVVVRWVGDTILGCNRPMIVSEVGFLRGDGGAGKDVGRIDCVLIDPGRSDLSWCALEYQAVYFSGDKMGPEYEALASHRGAGVPFPVGRHRPDYRSSGPKRLMPQLQIKVPTLRRWGKKMAVVVDRAFFGQLSKMEGVADISNADIAWFVVNYREERGRAFLVPDFVHYTTLERAVDGLTAGLPLSLDEFEAGIRAKLPKSRRL